MIKLYYFANHRKDLGVQGKTIVQESKSHLKHEENWMCWHLDLNLGHGLQVSGQFGLNSETLSAGKVLPSSLAT